MVRWLGISGVLLIAANGSWLVVGAYAVAMALTVIFVAVSLYVAWVERQRANAVLSDRTVRAETHVDFDLESIGIKQREMELLVAGLSEQLKTRPVDVFNRVESMESDIRSEIAELREQVAEISKKLDARS